MPGSKLAAARRHHLASLDSSTQLRDGDELPSVPLGRPSSAAVGTSLASSLPERITESKRSHVLQAGSLRLKDVAGLRTVPQSLTYLRLENNHLTDVSQLPWELLGNLTALNVYGNSIRKLPSEISKLRKLSILRAQNNHLQSIPAVIGSLHESLVELSIEGNSIENLPPELGFCSNLTHLRVDKNGLVHPFDLVHSRGVSRQLALLRKIHLNREQGHFIGYGSDVEFWTAHFLRNDITMVSLSGLKDESGLDELESDEESGEIHPLPWICAPGSLCDWSSITELKIEKVGLTSAPEGWEGCLSLTNLYLNDNRLTGLPNSLSQAPVLENLVLDCNPLVDWPDVINDMQTLCVLSIKKCKIGNLGNNVLLSSSASLRMLHLDGNPLKMLPYCLGELKSLQSLSIEDTLLHEGSLPPELVQRPLNLIKYLGQLHGVVGQGNASVILDGLGLQDVPMTVVTMTQLTSLDLRNNAITCLPIRMGFMTNLEILLLDGCEELHTPPQHLWKQGSKATVEFLQRMVSANETKGLWLQSMQLTSLPPDLHILNGVRVMDLSNNDISEIPAELGAWDAFQGLEELDVSHNPRLSILPRSLANIWHLRILRATHCDIRRLPPQIGALQSLVELHLDSNVKLSQPPVEIVSRGIGAIRVWCNQLCRVECGVEVLDASNLRLRKFNTNEVLKGSTHLLELVLKNNVIVEFPPGLGHMLPELRHLDISWNRLQELPASVGYLTNLLTLNIASNAIDELPEELSFCQKLQTLDISDNPIHTIPSVVGLVRSMNNLVCNRTPLRIPPPEVAKYGTAAILKFLRGLRQGILESQMDLSRLHLENVPLSACRITSVTSLNLDDNCLERVPNKLGRLVNLTLLAISRNKLTSVPKLLSCWPCLQTLHMQGNSISVLPPAIGQVTTLTELWMDRNQVSEIPETVSLLGKLRLLRLSDNSLASITASLYKCTALTMLKLERNPFKELPLGITALSQLSVLLIGGSDIEYLNSELCRMQKLSVLNTDACSRLVCPPQETRESGFDSLRGFLQRLWEAENTQRLDLSWQNLSSFTLPPSTARKLTGLNLARNSFSEFPIPVDDLPMLQSLHIQYNQLQKLPWRMGTLTNMTELAVSGNDLHYPMQELSSASGEDIIKLLRSVYATVRDCCKSHNLPDSDDEQQWSQVMTAGRNAKPIDLQEFGIMHLRDHFFNLPFLPFMSSLNLGHNPLESISGSISKMYSLSLLNLECCDRLSYLPDELAALSDLQVLDIRGCKQLKRLPASLCQCKKLSRVPFDDDTGLQLPELSVVSRGGPAIRRLLAGLSAALASRALDIPSCGITFLPLDQLPMTLVRINVSSNYISELPDAIWDWPMLEHVDASFNRLSGLKETVGHLEQLQRLNLAGNLIPSLPTTVGYLGKLQILNVSSNRIFELPWTLSRCTSLRHLNVSSNPIDTLDATIFDVPLTRLNISNSGITHVPWEISNRKFDDSATGEEGFSDLLADGINFIEPPLSIWRQGLACTLNYFSRLMTSLETGTADLSCLKLSSVPDRLITSTCVTSLDLSDNDFTEIPDNLLAMGHLMELKLHGNNLSFLPSKLGVLSSITALTFDADKIKSPPPSVLQSGTRGVLQYLKGFEMALRSGSMNLSGGGYTSIPEEVFEVTGIHTLDMSHNSLETLPDEVCTMSALTNLSVSKNLLREVPDWIGKLTSLTKLSLDGNNIRELPLSILECSNLAELNALPNPIVTPPTIVCERGAKGIRMYLIAVRDGEKDRKMKLSGLGMAEIPDAALDRPSITSLDISHNEIEHLASEITFLPLLQSLNCSNNRIKSISPDISELTGLTELNLQHNQIVSIPLSISRLTNLTSLLLEGNSAIQVPPTAVVAKGTALILQFLSASSGGQGGLLSFAEFGLESIALDLLPTSGVSAIDVSRNSMERLPGAILTMTTLTSIDCGHNILVSLPTDIGDLQMLQHLICGHNRIKHIPSSLSLCEQLTELDISGNPVQSLPPDLSSLTSLKSLDFSHTTISALPGEFSSLVSLQRVFADDCCFHRIEPCIICWKSLEHLSIRNCPIGELPWTLGSLEKLTKILAQGCPLEEPPTRVAQSGGEAVVIYLKGLFDSSQSGNLKLSHMQLLEPPKGLYKMTSITKLSLASNSIEDIPEVMVRTLVCLVELDFSSNMLGDLPSSIADWESLRSLNLSDNEIMEFPLSLCKMLGLVHLDVSKNRLQNLPLSILGMNQLTTLSLLGNAWSSPPNEVVQRGIQSVNRYLVTLYRVGGIPASADPWLEYGGFDVALEIHHGDVDSVDSYDTQPDEKDSEDAAIQFWMDALCSIAEYPVHGPLEEWDALTAIYHYHHVSARAPDGMTPLVLEHESPQKHGEPNTAHELIPNEGLPLFPKDQLGSTGVQGRLDVRGMRLKSLDAIFDDVGAVDTLWGCDNLISNLPTQADHISKAKRVKAIAVAGCQLSRVPDMAMKSANIQLVDLRNNVIQTLSDEQLRMPTLRSLLLDECQIHLLPSGISQLSNLTVLSMQQNGLIRLPQQVSALGCLQLLKVNHNALGEICPQIGSCKKLKVLDVSYNMLQRFPDEIGRCHSLRALKAHDNKLSEFPLQCINNTILESLEIHNNIIPAIPADFAKMSSLKVMTIHNNMLVSPPMDIIEAGLDSIRRFTSAVMQAPESRRLELRNLFLTAPPDDVWHQRLSKLNTLDLAGNRLRTIGPAPPGLGAEIFGSAQADAASVYKRNLTLSPLENLTKLDLCGNELIKIPNDFTNLISLTDLDISDNELSVLPVEVGRLTALASISVDGNPWASPPPPLIHMVAPELTMYLRKVLDSRNSAKMSIPHHSVAVIPPEVMQVSVLKSLNISNNVIDVVDPSIGYLRNLGSVDLSNNQIHSLPWEFGRCLLLKAIDLSHNQIQEVPPVVASLSNVTSLKLHHNQIVTLPLGMGNLTLLKELQIQNNLLTMLPPNFGKWKQLRSLDCSCCRLVTLPNHIHLLESIQSLKFDHNPAISEISETIGQCQNLERVEAQDCGLLGVPSQLSQASNLKSVNLARNRVNKLPPELGKSQTLSELFYDGNPIDDPPPGVLKRGTAAVLAYLSKLFDTRASGHLDLTDLSLESLPQELFQSDRGSAPTIPIRKLSLRGNRLKYLPLYIADLRSLEQMETDDTLDEPPLPVRLGGVGPVQEYLGSLRQAMQSRRLFFSGRQLHTLNISYYGLENLSSLFIDDNGLKTLPAGLEACTRLTMLSASRNNLQHLPDSFSKLSKLRIADLRHNSIPSLPAGIKHLTCLSSLVLDYNNITIFSHSFWDDCPLSTLSMHNCPLTATPALSGSRLQQLDLRSCNITSDMDALPSMYGLRHALLRGNGLNSLPDGLRKLQQLESIDLGCNDLSELPSEIGRLPRLTSVDASGNRIRELPRELWSITTLVRLRVDQNELTALSPQVGDLTNLIELRIDNNKLTTLPMELGKLVKLESFSVENNPSMILPAAVAKRGMAAVLEFFEFNSYYSH